MTPLDPESVDLAALAQALEQRVPTVQREGEVVGRTVLRDAVAAHLGCSVAMAENIVDTMVARGFLAWDGAPPPGRWRLRRS